MKLRSFVPAGTEALGVNLGDNKENADAYREPNAEATKILANLVEGFSG